MPSERFLNLPEEKKSRILEAAIREFNRAEFEQVSINRIIQDAGIPRGSFYQYFENKEDLAVYLISDFLIGAGEGIKEYLRQDLGDLFVFFQFAIDYALDLLKDENNAFLFISIVPELFNTKSNLPQDGLINQMVELKNFLLQEMQAKYYTQLSIEDLDIAWDILWSQLRDSICVASYIGMKEDQIKAAYLKKLQIIKAGFVHEYLS